MLKRLAALGLLPVLAAVACNTPADDDIAASTDQAVTTLPNLTDWANGTHWSYEKNFVGLPHAWVYTPSSFSKKAAGKRAVLFHLPGCGELPYQLAQGSGWPQVAEDNGFVVVIPEVIRPIYPNVAAPNVGCYDFGQTAFDQPSRYSTDHAALIKAGSDIAKKKPELQIDPRQIYIAGLSAGATVAMQVACMAPEVFAGVGSVAGPSLGTWQSAAVMPPVWDSSAVRWGCEYYADESPKKEMLNSQVYAIVSDDNGLPAGTPILEWGVWTATKFANQDIWDGDKYIPFAHHQIIADAMAPLFGAKQTGKDVALPGLNGIGYGCPGGEKSHDDTDETECPVSGYLKRPWQVKADVWTDEAGRQRIVHLKQDTLRHRWPVGPAGPMDHPVTPTFPDLVAAGYMTAHAEVNETKAAGAPSGSFGVGFFGDDTFNFTKYLAEFLTKNNPRL